MGPARALILGVVLVGAWASTKQKIVNIDALALMQALDFGGIPARDSDDHKSKTYHVDAVACFEASGNAIFPLYQCNKPNLGKNPAAAKLLFDALSKKIPNRLNPHAALVRTGPIACTFTFATKTKAPKWECEVDPKF